MIVPIRERLEQASTWRVSLALVACYVILVVACDPRGDFPIHDDWVYALAVRTLVTEGTLRIPDFSSALAIPQIAWGALFCLPAGFSHEALRWSTIVAGALAVLGTRALIEETTDDRVLAALGAAAFLVNPLFLAMATTFMTDVPFATLVAWSLAALVRGLRRQRAAPIATGLALAVVSAAHRQVALALFAGFALAILVRRRWTAARMASAVLLVGVALLGELAIADWLFETGRKSFGMPITAASRGASIDALRSGARTGLGVWLALGLFVAPLAWATWRGSRALLIGAIAAGAVLVACGLRMPLVGDVVGTSGIGPLMLRDTLLLGQNRPVPSTGTAVLWSLLTIVATCGAFLVTRAAVVVTTAADDDRVRTGALLAGTLVGYVVLVATAAGNAFFDRYLLAMIPIALALICRPASSSTTWSHRVLATVAIVLLVGILSACAVHDRLDRERTRWRAFDDLVAEGVSPARIDGGYEINGWLFYDPWYEPHDWKSWWWVRDDEYVIAAGPLDGYAVVRSYPTHPRLPGNVASIEVLKRQPD